MASEASRVGPIVFADPVARRQLVESREVVTFRASERTTGATWWRESRTGPKAGECRVEYIGPCDPAKAGDLAAYRGLSGFQSIATWQDAIRDLNGGLSDGHLYHVTGTGGGADGG